MERSKKKYPFKPIGISHPYELDQDISVLSVAGWYFSFYSHFKRTFCRQTLKTPIRRRVQRRLIWVCTVCLCPTKRTLGPKISTSIVQTPNSNTSLIPIPTKSFVQLRSCETTWVGWLPMQYEPKSHVL